MDEMEALKTELEHYKNEKDKIRDVVGQVGGKSNRRRHTVINFVFLLLVMVAFAFDLLRSVMGWGIAYLPSHLILGIAVLLVSLKIIWMIHTQSKVDHFQFWVLNSIEFQINMLSRRIADLSETVRTMNGASQQPQDRQPAGARREVLISRRGRAAGSSAIRQLPPALGTNGNCALASVLGLSAPSTVLLCSQA